MKAALKYISNADFVPLMSNSLSVDAGNKAAGQPRAARSVESFVVPAFLAIYFFSGFAALLYQVIWQRMLTIFSGADLYATTTIVASFMGGLGTGSLCAGALADRVSARWQIGLFALAELLTGIFGLLSKWWY